MAGDKVIILTRNPSDLLKDVVTTLGLADYEVHAVTTKEYLLNYSRRENPDLIIKDISGSSVCDVETIRFVETMKNLA